MNLNKTNIVKCPFGNDATSLCTSDRCDHKPLVCNNPKCSCNKLHSICSEFTMQKYEERIKETYNNNLGMWEEIAKWCDNLAKQVRIFQDQVKNKYQEQQTFLNGDELKLFRGIFRGREEDITKQVVVSVFKKIQKPSEESINQKLKVLQIELKKQSFEVENILKRAVKLLSPFKEINKTDKKQTTPKTNKNSNLQKRSQHIFKSNDKYIGQWNGSELEGYGIYTWQNGDIYQGYWKEGKRHGVGKLNFANGHHYEGDFIENHFQGKGKYNYSSGNIYEGEYKNDKKHGFGTYIWTDGDKYVGNFQQNKLHGKGKYFYSGGSSYDGDFVLDNKDGYGVYTYTDGSRYQGHYKAGKKDGEGKQISSQGKIKQGVWQNDVMLRETK